MIPTTFLQRHVVRQPILPAYTQVRSTLSRVARHGVFLAFCILLGFFYGLCFAIFPPQLYVWLAAPILVLALLVIWALPDGSAPPARSLRFLVFAYMISLASWPNYLAIALPGLPWITIARLISFPLFLVLCIGASTSKSFRDGVKDSVHSLGLFWRGLLFFILLQLVTIAFSTRPFESLSAVFTPIVMVIAPFIAAAWVFRKPGLATKWLNILVGLSIFLCIIGLMEGWQQKVLWADHIPPFLKVDGDLVAKILQSAIRDGAYRVVAIFSVSLSFAEFLCLVTPLVLHKAFVDEDLYRKTLWVGVDLLLLVVIVSTQSRLGIVGWLVAHVMYICVWSLRRWQTNKIDIIGPAVTIMFSAAAAVFFLAMFTVPAVKNRTIGGGSTGLSDAGRDAQYALFWPKLAKWPFGHGAGTSGEVLGYFTPGGQLTVDSSVISIGLDYGVLGLILYFGMFIAASFALIRLSFKIRKSELDLMLPLGVSVGIFILIRYILNQTENNALIFMMLGVAAALAARARAQDASEEPRLS